MQPVSLTTARSRVLIRINMTGHLRCTRVLKASPRECRIRRCNESTRRPQKLSGRADFGAAHDRQPHNLGSKAGNRGEADHVIRPIVDRDLSLVWQLPPAGPVNIQLSYPH